MVNKEALEQILFKEQMRRLDKIKEKLDGESQDILDDIVDKISNIEISWGIVTGVILTIPTGKITREKIKKHFLQMSYPKMIDEMIDDYVGQVD